MIKKIVALFCVFTLLISTGCVKEEKTSSFTVIDQAGREVTLEKPAQKVASGYYISTTILIGLGQTDKLTGVEMKAETRPIYKLAAPEVLDLPALGNKKMFNVEECAKAQPDVVFLPVSLKDYVDDLEALDIQTILLAPETEEGFEKAVELIGQVMGCTDRVEEYFTYQEKVLETYEVDEEVETKVYFAGSDVLSGAGELMYQEEILDYAGAENALDIESETWVNVDAETLLKANPDVIFIEQGNLTVESFTEDPRFQEVNAVKNHQVYMFPSLIETWDTPGLSSLLGKIWAASIIHPELVSKEDVEKESQKFYSQFYGFDCGKEDLGI